MSASKRTCEVAYGAHVYTVPLGSTACLGGVAFVCDAASGTVVEGGRCSSDQEGQTWHGQCEGQASRVCPYDDVGNVCGRTAGCRPDITFIGGWELVNCVGTPTACDELSGSPSWCAPSFGCSFTGRLCDGAPCGVQRVTRGPRHSGFDCDVAGHACADSARRLADGDTVYCDDAGACTPVVFPPRPMDWSVYYACKAYFDACENELPATASAACTTVAGFASSAATTFYECTRTHGCDPAACTPPTPSPLSTEVCAAWAACGAPCTHEETEMLGFLGFALHAHVLSALRSCLAFGCEAQDLCFEAWSDRYM